MGTVFTSSLESMLPLDLDRWLHHTVPTHAHCPSLRLSRQFFLKLLNTYCLLHHLLLTAVLHGLPTPMGLGPECCSGTHCHPQTLLKPAVSFPAQGCRCQCAQAVPSSTLCSGYGTQNLAQRRKTPDKHLSSEYRKKHLNV